MDKFCDSPYFLLKDFMRLLVAPVSDEYIKPDIINFNKDVIFVDVLWLGGRQYLETSTDQFNTLNRYPLFDENTDTANVFKTSDVAWNAWFDRSPMKMYYIDPEEPFAGMLRSGTNSANIIVDGGSYIELYAKLDDYGFVPVILHPIYEDPRDKKYFRFDVEEMRRVIYDESETIIYNSDNPSDEPYYDSEYVSIQTYNYELTDVLIKWGNLTIDDILKNSTEIYFRKDSSYHDWLKLNANKFYKDKKDVDFIIRDYVNTDIRFIYFGKVYETPNEDVVEETRYHIVFNGMKDWVKSALPEPNRTPNMIEFFDTYFDEVYAQGYQLLKNIWTLRDGRECDRKFLGYIPTFFDMPNEGVIDDWFLDAYREYASELVWLMKRKGTFASLYIIYEILSIHSNNILSVMERWHEIPDQASIESIDYNDHIITSYDDHIYTELYNKDTPDGLTGAGVFWYSKFDKSTYPDGDVSSDNKMLSPYYRVDLDVSVEPMTMFSILPEQVITSMYKNWELMRPVHRQVDYNIVYAPFTDVTGKWYSLYNSPYQGQSLSKSNVNRLYDDNNFLYIQKGDIKTWMVEHNLDTMDVVITSYNSELKKQIPQIVEVIDKKTIMVRFGEQTNGILIVSKSSGINYACEPISWRIRHGYNRKEVIWQVRGDDDIVYYPEGSVIADNNTIYIDGATQNSTLYINQGISIGDLYDSDFDYLDDSEITDDIWVFGSVLNSPDAGMDFGRTDAMTHVDGRVERFELNVGEWYVAWIIQHPFPLNIWQINCYDIDNRKVEPMDILLNEVDAEGNPIIVILWDTFDSRTPSFYDFCGFAAIKPIGDIVSFYGVVPLDLEGTMLPVKWRLCIETDDEVFSFLEQDDKDAQVMFEGKNDKIIHYYNTKDPQNKPFVEGFVDKYEEDDDWYYYTIIVKNEALYQLEERGYNILAIEVFNQRVRKYSRQRIVFNKLSGIYKPFGVNFICFFRIYKDPDGLNNVLLDHNNIILYDDVNDELTA